MIRSRLFIVFLACAASAPSAVSQTNRTNLASAIGRADQLIATIQQGLPSYHLHYDLRLVHRRNQESTGTFDFIWAAPASTRIEKSADASHSLSVRVRTKMSYVNEGGMSLRMMEFDYERTRPFQEVNAVMSEGALPPVVPTKIDGAVMECASAGSGSAERQVCFQENTGFYSSAVMDGTRVTYDGWTPVGARFVPTIIRLTRGKKLLLEAHGTVQILDSVPADTFLPPSGSVLVDTTKTDQHNIPLGEPQDPHQVVHRDPPLVRPPTGVFGYVIVKVEVGTKGIVTKASVVDSDDPALEDAAISAARAAIWAPYEVNGQAIPFEDELFSTFHAPLR